MAQRRRTTVAPRSLRSMAFQCRLRPGRDGEQGQRIDGTSFMVRARARGHLEDLKGYSTELETGRR
jgi:hypothetical protein